MSQAAITHRCLDTLELMAGAPAGLPLTSIAQRLRLAKSATHRLLAALQAEGCVVQDPHSQFYRMTLRIPIMGLRHLAGTGIVYASQPYLDQLAARTGELVRLTVADDGHLIWVAKAQGAKSELRFDPEMGQEVRLHTTATGKAWLASLPPEVALRVLRAHGFGRRHGSKAASLDHIVKEVNETRRRGYGIAIDEDEIGMSAVAAAIRAPDAQARVLGTVSVAGPSVRLPRSQLEAIAKDLLATAKKLAAAWPQSHEPLPAREPSRPAPGRKTLPRRRAIPRADKSGRSAAPSRN